MALLRVDLNWQSLNRLAEDRNVAFKPLVPAHLPLGDRGRDFECEVTSEDEIS